MGPGAGAGARSRTPGRDTPEDVRRISGKGGGGGRKSYGQLASSWKIDWLFIGITRMVDGREYSFFRPRGRTDWAR